MVTRRRIGVLLFGWFLFAAIVSAATPGPAPRLSDASWIWTGSGGIEKTGRIGFFRRKFQLSDNPAEATILITADNGYELFVNNRRVAAELGYDTRYWKSVERFRIEDYLVEGANVIAIRAESLGGGAGLVAAASVGMEGGQQLDLVTDTAWLCSKKEADNWAEPDHDDSVWSPAVAVAKMGGGQWSGLSVSPQVTDPKRLSVDARLPGGAAPPAPDRFEDPSPEMELPAGIVFVAGRGPVQSERRAQAKWEVRGSQASFEYDVPAPAAAGRRLYALTPVVPDAVPQLLLDAGSGLLASPAVSYDASEIVFAMAAEDDKFFHLYRIGVDGGGLARLTDGPWNDFDPAFLPDGRIVFASSRTGSRDEYHANTARSLFCLSADRQSIRPLTYHIVADSQPAVTADGRIVFVRHDNFLERAKVETRIHSVHPDGTAGQTLVGPDRAAIRYDRPTAAEHGASWLRNFGFGVPAPLPDGRVACLTHHGPLITTVSLRGQVGNERIPTGVRLFDFAPLPDGHLLCSGVGGVLGVLDPDSGQVVKLFEMEGEQLHSVEYLGPRPRPPAMAPMVDPQDALDADKSGYLFCQNVADSQQLDADWDRVKAVRVFEGRPFSLRAARHHYGHIGTEGVELGTAPIAPDGSFFLRVPADRAIAMQMVDAEGRAVVNEMSWIYVRPGEQRSCVGCHNHRQAAPRFSERPPQASFRPVDLVGDAAPHRFRANNAANGGVLNLQLDRFREVASFDLYPGGVGDEAAQSSSPPPPGRPTEVARLVKVLEEGRFPQQLSACRRLAIFRDRAAVSALVAALDKGRADLRRAAGLALAACGNRDAVDPLIEALADRDPTVARSAQIALEHLTGHAEPLDVYAGLPSQAAGQENWRTWRAKTSWEAVEEELIGRLDADTPVAVHLAIEALGHTGGDAARTALRIYVERDDGRDLRATMAAIRSLGYLGDQSAVPLLAKILNDNIAKQGSGGGGSHEFGFLQRPVQMAGVAAEALGWIGTPEAETALLKAFGSLAEFWYYTFQTADHSWLMGCHSSIPHYRIAEALDAMGSTAAAPIVGRLLESVPQDSDRGLWYEADAYETVTARVIHRAGRAGAVIETCLAVLGDPGATPDESLRGPVTVSPPASSTGKLSAESRAAQLLAVVCRGPQYLPRVREAFERHQARAPSRQRSWTCFFLARTLGEMRDVDAVPVLIAALTEQPPEAVHGIPNAPNVFLNAAMTPTHRAAAAFALGSFRDEASPAQTEMIVAALSNVVADYDNAMDVRRAAARGLARIARAEHVEQLEQLTSEYPEIVTQHTLLHAAAEAKKRKSPK